MKKLISAFLIIHGLIHIMFEFSIYDPNTSEYVGWTRQSWILSKALGTTAVTVIGLMLWSLTIGGFVIAGILLLMEQKEWRYTAVITAVISLITYLFLWDGLAPDPMSWIAGPIVNGLIILALILIRWPKDEKMFTVEQEKYIPQ